MINDIEKLKCLVGVNSNEAIKFLKKKKMLTSATRSKNIRGIAIENLVALLLDQDFPSSNKGKDFDNFELKTVQVRYNKNNSMRVCGDTPIAALEKNKTEFINSNIYDKTKSIISILVHDDVIVDILHLDGSKHIKELKSDYDRLYTGESNFIRKDGKTWRQVEGVENKILVRKDYRNSVYQVMIKGNQIIDLSKSLTCTPNLIIDRQTEYLESIFLDKIKNYNNRSNKTKFVKLPVTKSTKNRFKIRLNEKYTENYVDNFENRSKVNQKEILEQLHSISDLSELIKCKKIINDKLDDIFLEMSKKNAKL